MNGSRGAVEVVIRDTRRVPSNPAPSPPGLRPRRMPRRDENGPSAPPSLLLTVGRPRPNAVVYKFPSTRKRRHARIPRVFDLFEDADLRWISSRSVACALLTPPHARSRDSLPYEEHSSQPRKLGIYLYGIGARIGSLGVLERESPPGDNEVRSEQWEQTFRCAAFLWTIRRATMFI